jgi:predicted ABC-type ATPase
MPNLFIIAGPNGAGKTTYVKRFLPQEMQCREFVNADLIAAGLSPFAPDKAAYEAGRIMLNRLRELAARREDFSFETTLSGRAYAPLLRDLRAAGYRIRLDFLWSPNLGITNQRVRQRVAKGGHNIPEEVQLRRFRLGVRNLAELYRPLIDYWRLFENTKDRPHLVAEEQAGVLRIVDGVRLAQIEQSASVRFMPDIPSRGARPTPTSSSRTRRGASRSSNGATESAWSRCRRSSLSRWRGGFSRWMAIRCRKKRSGNC